MPKRKAEGIRILSLWIVTLLLMSIRVVAHQMLHDSPVYSIPIGNLRVWKIYSDREG